MSNDKQPVCDSCRRRISKRQHELVLSDFTTGQKVGHYHARPDCQESAVEYMQQPGAVLMATFVHPDRCGPDQECCDGGVSEHAA
jgi:hypothetical protein